MINSRRGLIEATIKKLLKAIPLKTANITHRYDDTLYSGTLDSANDIFTGLEGAVDRTREE